MRRKACELVVAASLVLTGSVATTATPQRAEVGIALVYLDLGKSNPPAWSAQCLATVDAGGRFYTAAHCMPKSSDRLRIIDMAVACEAQAHRQRELRPAAASVHLKGWRRVGPDLVQLELGGMLTVSTIPVALTPERTAFVVSADLSVCEPSIIDVVIEADSVCVNELDGIDRQFHPGAEICARDRARADCVRG